MKRILLLLVCLTTLLLSGCKSSGKICGQSLDIDLGRRTFDITDECTMTLSLRENADGKASSEIVLLSDDFSFDGKEGGVRTSLEWDKRTSLSLALKAATKAQISGEITVLVVTDWSAGDGKNTLSQTYTSVIYYASDGETVAFSLKSLDDALGMIK